MARSEPFPSSPFKAKFSQASGKVASNREMVTKQSLVEQLNRRVESFCQSSFNEVQGLIWNCLEVSLILLCDCLSKGEQLNVKDLVQKTSLLKYSLANYMQGNSLSANSAKMQLAF